METSKEYLQPDVPAKCQYGKNSLMKDPHPKLARKSYQKIYPNMLDCIGNTPLIKLNRIPQSLGIKCDVLVKCEFLNPGGSIKDRMSLSMIEDAENRGLLKPGSVMIEPTSGNTGIAMAMIAAIKDYQTIFVMPEKSSREKEDILKALGSEVVRVSDKIPYNEVGGLYWTPLQLHKQIPNSIILHQFGNASNPLSHYYQTSMEIFEDCEGKLDMMVMGAGTGGTITGIGRKFKEILPECLIVGVDPYASTMAEPPSLNETDLTYTFIEGIGLPYNPSTLDKSVVDFWVKVYDGESLSMARRMHKEEGLLCGGSSGSILCGGLKAAKRLKKGQRCVIVLPDGIQNYLTKFVSDYWMEVRNFIPCENTLNHWWWNLEVSLLNPTVNLFIPNNASCKKAVDIMNNHGCDLLPVVDRNMYLLGTVTSKNLLTLMLDSPSKFNESIEIAVNSKFASVTRKSNFGMLSRILDNEGIAVVVNKEPDQQNSKFVGVLFLNDFLEYISKKAP